MRRLIVAWAISVLVLATRGAEWWLIGVVVLVPVLLALITREARRLPPDPETDEDWRQTRVAP